MAAPQAFNSGSSSFVTGISAAASGDGVSGKHRDLSICGPAAGSGRRESVHLELQDVQGMRCKMDVQLRRAASFGKATIRRLKTLVETGIVLPLAR